MSTGLHTQVKQSTQSQSFTPAFTGILQQKCDSSEYPEHYKKGLILQRYSADFGEPSAVPPVVEEVLRSLGEPLDPTTRAFMEPRFGHDFSKIRVHRDARAAEAARAVNARAFTMGRDVVFGAGEYIPGMITGQKLLAHELTHVIQQSDSGTSVGIEHEVDADRAAAGVMAGRAVQVETMAQIAVQRQEKEGSRSEETEKPKGKIERVIVNRILASYGPGIAQSPIAAAALTGMIFEIVEQLGPGGKGARFLWRVASISPKDALKYTGGYTLGLVEGIISPITDLFRLTVFGEHMRVMTENLLLSTINRRGELADDLQQLLPSLEAIDNAMDIILSNIRAKPGETILALVSLPQRLSDEAEKMAFTMGRRAGAEIVNSLEEPWSEKAEEVSAPNFLRQPLGWISSKVEGLESQLIEAPWAKIGNKVGYAVGFVAINIVLFAFTEGIGNLITQLGNALGKVSKALGALGRGLKAIAGVVTSVGTAVAEIEKLIALGISKLLKPLESILEPLMKPLTEFFERLRTFLRKLFGVVEKEAAPALASATTKGAGAAVRDIEGRMQPPSSIPTPKSVPKPVVTPTIAAEQGVELGPKITPKPSPPPVGSPEIVPPKAPPTEVPKVPPEAAIIEKPPAEPTPAASAVKPAEPAATGKLTTPVTEPKPASRAKLFEGISKDTKDLFRRRPGLARVLEQHPEAANLFKLCKSPCFPAFMTDEEIAERLLRLERIMNNAKKSGIDIKRGGIEELGDIQDIKEMLHKQKTKVDVDGALDEIENLVQRKKFEMTAAPKSEATLSEGYEDMPEPSIKTRVSLEEDHHIATRYRKKNQAIFKRAGLNIDDDLNLIKDFPEHGQLRGWYNWENRRYRFNMKGHHPKYNEWVTRIYDQAIPPGLPPDKALSRIENISRKLNTIIRKHPEILSHGPEILPKELQDVTFD